MIRWVTGCNHQYGNPNVGTWSPAACTISPSYEWPQCSHRKVLRWASSEKDMFGRFLVVKNSVKIEHFVEKCWELLSRKSSGKSVSKLLTVDLLRFCQAKLVYFLSSGDQKCKNSGVIWGVYVLQQHQREWESGAVGQKIVGWWFWESTFCHEKQAAFENSTGFMLAISPLWQSRRRRFVCCRIVTSLLSLLELVYSSHPKMWLETWQFFGISNTSSSFPSPAIILGSFSTFRPWFLAVQEICAVKSWEFGTFLPMMWESHGARLNMHIKPGWDPRLWMTVKWRTQNLPLSDTRQDAPKVVKHQHCLVCCTNMSTRQTPSGLCAKLLWHRS